MISEHQPPPYDFKEPLGQSVSRLGEPLFYELIGTRAFRRLADVRFLGGIDYFLVRTPNGSNGHRRYTRYQHSLGVARLAHLYASERDLPVEKRRLAYAAALLHDIGHAPLSHTLEPIFKKAFAIDHHTAGTEILRGVSPLGDDVTKALTKYGLDPDEVLAVASGDLDPFEGFFSGPINFDTIEGILRSWVYLGLQTPPPSPEQVLLAAIHRRSVSDRDTVDRFWEYKDRAYRYIIRSEFGVTADYLCEMVVERHLGELSRSDFFSSEHQLFDKLPALKRLLKVFRIEQAPEVPSAPLAYKARFFNVDASHDFFARDDRGRYRQTKEDRFMRVPDPLQASLLAPPHIPDFFDDLLRRNQAGL